MSTVLAYHKQRSGEHWFNSTSYGPNEIDSIEDPQGGDTKQQPTSIPSPFARFDLVRSAFGSLLPKKNLKTGTTKNSKLSGSPNNERLVSEAFDVGEVLFNYENLKDKLKIIPWSMIDLNTLTSSLNEGHKNYGDALKLYLEQDSHAYNFNKIKRIFIIFYQGKIIGGTSPSTVFFSSPNELSNIDIKFGDHRLFNKEYVPLYKRDIEYQKFWYCLQRQQGFRKYFVELDEYLTESLKILESDYNALYHKHIKSANGEDLLDTKYYEENFAILDTGKPEDNLEVLGLTLRKQKTKDKIDSEFIIKSDKYAINNPGKPLPLILKNKYPRSLKYTTRANWDVNTPVASYIKESWKTNSRTLPGLSEKYPWLTISDFFEPFLVRVNYPINKENFFFGTQEGLNENKGYLLPINKDFFDFFDWDDLKSGRVKYAMSGQGGGSVKVSLQIPISNNGSYQEYITFERLYLPMPQGLDLVSPDVSQNIGFIVDQPFTLSIYPLVRTGTVELNPEYRIQVVEKISETVKNQDVALDFYDQSENKSVGKSPLDKDNKDSRYRTPRDSKYRTATKYYLIKKEFDYITIEFVNSRQPINAIIIPEWEKYSGGQRSFSFSIDFGTTNSHIEYKIDNNPPKPFGIERRQVATIISPHHFNDEIEFQDAYIFYMYEFIPLMVGPNSEYSFPIRTAITESDRTNHDNQFISTLVDFNIPFYYEKETKKDNDIVFTNLKWAANDLASKNRMKAFLEELVLMIRNKVILENGDLARTKIFWFFPASMPDFRIDELAAIWTDLYKQHINSEDDGVVPRPISESIAPFYHYKEERSNLLTADRPAVSIDIGGGTTDAVIYFKNKPELLTSFRFAGNAVFGDGFKERAANSNGFVMRFDKRMQRLLDENNLKKLSKYNKDIIAGKKSEDIISFWFAIEKNPDVHNRDLLSFNKKLSEDREIKIVFLLFYVSVVYHISKMMKHKKYQMPGSFIFSGTGSKILNIISSNDTRLSELTKVIIEEVYGEKYTGGYKLAVHCDRETPKEATCKGALWMKEADYNIRPQDIAYVYTATSNDSFEKLTYEDADKPEVKESIMTEVEDFLDFFFRINDEDLFSFEDKLGISSNAIKIAEEVCRDYLPSFLAEGIEMKKTEGFKPKKKLEETLFFYPLLGVLNNLAHEIAARLPVRD